MREQYFRTVNVVIIVYSVTNQQSFANVRQVYNITISLEILPFACMNSKDTDKILMALSLLYIYICYYPIATFQKAGTCLDAQQSMAKQTIKGCVSNHNRTCGKSVSKKIRINLKALEETSMFFLRTKNFN